MSRDCRLEYATKSHTGRVRAHNEDAVAVDPAFNLAILADGMGGYNAGEIASAMAVNRIREYVASHGPTITRGKTEAASGLQRFSALLREAVEDANRSVFEAAHTRAAYRGMGTTVVALLAFGDRIAVAHVGDSRAYRLRQGRLERLTQDHSLHEELMSRGLLTAEESASASHRNVITRALGVEPEVEVDLVEDRTRANDLLLLSSDGLHDLVEDSEIQATMMRYSFDLHGLSAALVDKANEKGGKDNISVIAIRPTLASKGWIRSFGERWSR